jgi:5-methylcytosine-specific restriction endonuclease McrA
VIARGRYQRSAARRGYGYSWRKVRAYVLASSPWCAGFPHSRHGSEPVAATTVDHIVGFVNGGTSALSNLQSLCASCQAIKSIEVEGSGSYRRG